MIPSFQAESGPTADACRWLEEGSTTNPFATGSYLSAMELQGYQPWILSVWQKDRPLAGCGASMKSGRLNKWLQIDSLPTFERQEEERAFWSGLERFCKDHRVSFLQLNSFGARSVSIPHFRYEIWRRGRFEFVLALKDRDLWALLSSNHRRNIRRAMKSGVVVRQASSEEACRQHVSLMAKSMERRSQRGEVILAAEDIDPYLALVQARAAEFYQAVHEDAVVSSILVLKSSRGAYYHSAGTSPEGMSLGASHFLIHESGKNLQAQAVEVFNLGGASEEGSGLARFKGGFGGEVVELESAEVFLGGTLKKTLNRLVEALGR